MEELLPLIAEVGGKFKDLNGSLGMASQISGAFASAISKAGAAITSAFGAIANAVAPFVQALNPSLMFGLNQAMRDLQATIGTALTPVVSVLTATIRQVSGILLPVMQQLTPIMEKLTHIVSDFLIPPFLFLADIVDGLAPLFSAVADIGAAIVDAWLSLVQVTRAVVQSVLAWVKGLFGPGDMKAFLKDFKDAIHAAVGALLKFTAYLAKSLGQLGFIDQLAKNLRELGQVKPGAVAAATDVGMKGFEDIAKTMALAAFAAQSGGDPAANEEKKWRDDIAKEIEGIKNNGATLQQFLDKTLKDFEKWLTESYETLANKIGKALNPLAD